MSNHRRNIIKSSESLQTPAGPMDYTLSRSHTRRTLAIAIDDQARVQVSVPFRTPLDEIHAFLQEKAAWVQKCIMEARRQQAFLLSKQYVHGAEFLFLGKKFPLNIREDDIKRACIAFDHRGWEVRIPKGTKEKKKTVERKMKQWYKQQAQEILGAKTFQFARDIGVNPKKIQIRNQRRLWGCCDWNTQSITLNWQIILAPRAVVDYVVIHELCHLVHPNHGKRFWAKVAKHMPYYEGPRKWLRDYQIKLMLPQ